MSPDDPRHGEYRGALQHRKDNEKPCGPCEAAAFRHHKETKRYLDAGIRRRVPLGEEAWKALTSVPPKALAQATGIRPGTIYRLRSRQTGPDAIVRLSTRTAILNSYRRAVTPIGLARRLQAITAMGHSMKVVADGTPFAMDTYKRVRRATGRMFVEQGLGECILAAYELYAMYPAAESPSSHRTRKWAEANGWLTALAWEDESIDDPDAKPQGLVDHSGRAILDEAAIERRIAGDRNVRLHKGETGEVVRRLRAAGLSSLTIFRDYGIKAERYTAQIRATQQNEEAAA